MQTQVFIMDRYLKSVFVKHLQKTCDRQVHTVPKKYDQQIQKGEGGVFQEGGKPG